MADLNNYDRPILTDNYVDCLDTIRENIKRNKASTDAVSAAQANYVLKAGDTLSGDLVIVRSGGSAYAMNNTIAGANLKLGRVTIESNGEIRIGGVNDAQTAWTRGIGIKTDGVLYNLLTGQPLTTASELSGYLPLGGGTLSGTLYIITNANTNFEMRST